MAVSHEGIVMDRTWARVRYRTRLSEDRTEGWVALELLREFDARTDLAARVTYWDAEGRFAFSMHGGELPLEIIEELVTEARAAIRIS